MKNRLFLFLIFIMGAAGLCHAQTHGHQPIFDGNSHQQDTTHHKFHLPDNLYLGGSLGLSFGDATYIGISPLAGYKITRALMVGIGGDYSYIAYKIIDPYNGQIVGRDNFSLYGVKGFTRYTLPFFKAVFLEGDIRAENVEDFSRPSWEHDRAWLFSPLVGAGLQSALGRKSYVYLSVLYDLNYYRNSSIFALTGSPLEITSGIMF